MKARILTAAGIAAAVIIGSTGCTFISRQATTIQYDAADQVSAHLGDVQLRGLLVIADEEGNGQLLLVAVNDSATTRTLSIQYTLDDGTRTAQTLTLAPHQTTSYGFGDSGDQLLLTGVTATLGTNLEIYFQAGDVSGVMKHVPVLGTDWEQYADLAPVLPIPETEVPVDGGTVDEGAETPTTEEPTTEEPAEDADH